MEILPRHFSITAEVFGSASRSTLNRELRRMHVKLPPWSRDPLSETLRLDVALKWARDVGFPDRLPKVGCLTGRRVR